MKKNNNTVLRIISYLKAYKFFLFLAIFLTIGSSIFEIISPKLMGNITTRIFENLKMNTRIDFDYVIKICITLGVVYLLQGVFEFFRGRILVDVTQDLIAKFRREISEKVKYIPTSYYDKNKTGDLLSRMTNDVETLGKNLQQTISSILSSIVLIVGILTVMIKISPTLTLVFLFTLPMTYFSTKFISKKSQGYFRRKSQGLGSMVGFVEENFSGSELIKAFNYEGRAEREFLDINENLYEVSYRASFMTGIMLPIMTFISNLGYVMLSIVGGLLVLSGKLFVGDIQAVIQYVRRLANPIEQLAEMASIFQASIAAAERIFEFLDQEPEEEIVTDEIKRPVEDIEFDKVYFSYDKKTPVINNLNLHVEKNKTVAIVGSTGAGKTTIVNLLMRFYDIDRGRININGVNIKDVSRKNLRSLFGMVLQDSWLFRGTIYDNILYGRQDATREEVIDAAKKAYCHSFIEKLPKGYDTVLNEEASNISQGQRQLLTIARALLSDPEILILDEATSSVDTRTEALIQKAMKNLLKERTNFVIAHRLSTIVNSDVILVLDKGDIVEKGNHKELLARDGIYAELYNSQFKN
ncbi:Putative multidrug export ATP-binding/permease protein SAV1866 [Peptoniphilus harei]|uniref:ABC transporter ATP-binding protein n=1 Tax=Peptoniphilus harei TaxID=54005 RepID=UPI000F6B7A20|nr:ABC transporter ATP-binding protein [Peptoniphilus harei]QQE46356.1 ABC transporter ATP-binding protein [Peptoniphilus harei]VEJ33422.1 Putative multidrug export ATP-binding/permease protein SAV1866 [Peptoniphilus harei]